MEMWASFSLRFLVHISNHFITVLILEGSFILANEIIVYGRLFCSPVSEVQTQNEGTKLSLIFFNSLTRTTYLFTYCTDWGCKKLDSHGCI